VARATVLLGHCASLHSHAKPPPHFASPGLATQALIRAGKTSYTFASLAHAYSLVCLIYSIFLYYKELVKPHLLTATHCISPLLKEYDVIHDVIFSRFRYCTKSALKGNLSDPARHYSQHRRLKFLRKQAALLPDSGQGGIQLPLFSKNASMP
jgi:hypothetical protein